MILPRDDDVFAHHPMHKAPIPQLRHVGAVLLRELRVPEHQRRFGRIPLLFPHDRDFGLVRQKRRLQQPRRLHETFNQRRRRQRIRQNDLVVLFPRVEQRQLRSGCGGEGEEKREEEFHVGT